ncbi:putative mitochondrial protein [Abeliophyllum distichum]|uniref:Mitochondrial protein n=1 Tax=Abeliophyllum distichum TaxID=126358 RepID=A0ABD1R156_9LAMI
MKWLATLGRTQVDWRELTMRFQVGETIVMLQGDPSLSKTLVSMKSMIKAFREKGEGVLLELGSITADFNEAQGPAETVVLVFFDDILIYSRTLKEHCEHLKCVLRLLEEHQLFANKNKCQFGQSKVEYLGHVISKDGVAADQSKIKATCDWPSSHGLKELRGFLGLTGYYRRCVQDYGKLAQPLTERLCKDNFFGDEVVEKAFQKLKAAMVTVPVLALPDLSKQFIVEIDASGHGHGAVLIQECYQIAYYSHALNP